MSKKMESQQKTPSVIARLMGLHELPPQKPLQRPQKVLSDDYLRKTASLGQLEKRSLNNGSLSKTSAEKQDNNYCSNEMQKIDKHVTWSAHDEKLSSSTVTSDFSFPRQRNSPNVYLSKDKKPFQLSGRDNMTKDLHEPKYDHHPDLSFKQSEDLNDLQPRFQTGWLSASTSTSTTDENDSEFCKKLDKINTKTTVLRSIEKLENSHGQTHNDILDKLKSMSDLKDRSMYPTRRIVVLKPNSRQAQTSARNLNTEVSETADATSGVEPPRQSFKVIRGASQLSGQVVKQDPGTSFGALSRSRATTDESSANVSERMSYQNSLGCKRRDRISYPFLSGSLFALEAKKQIFERWKTTRNFQEVEVNGRKCALGEMFVMHDGGMKPKTSYVESGKHVSSSQSSSEDENLKLGSPLRIGSKYVSKDKHMRSLARLEFFKRLSNLATIAEPSKIDLRLRHQDAATAKCINSKNKASHREDSLEQRDPRSNFTTIAEPSKSGLCLGHQDAATVRCINLENKVSHKEDILEQGDPRSSCEKGKNNSDNADLDIPDNIDQNIVFRRSVLFSGSDDTPVQVTQDIHREAKHISKAVSNFSTEALGSVNTLANAKAEPSLSSGDQRLLVEDGNTSSDVWENSNSQISSCDFPCEELNSRCAADPDLAMNLKEINQPSPNSVLELPFKEDNPFASVFSSGPVSDLSGLAMKLELLDSKSEETNSECSGMNVSIDGDSEKGSFEQYNRKLWEMFKTEESRDFSYLVDVLDETSLCDSNLDKLYETWYSTQSPVNPSVFEALEKKYGKQTTWLKSDRRLLFDSISFGLEEILNLFVGIQCSTKPLRRRFLSTLRRDEIEEELWMLILNQEKEASKSLSEKALGKDMKWLELEEDISIICREIEEFLFGELAAELKP